MASPTKYKEKGIVLLWKSDFVSSESLIARHAFLHIEGFWAHNLPPPSPSQLPLPLSPSLPFPLPPLPPPSPSPSLPFPLPPSPYTASTPPPIMYFQIMYSCFVTKIITIRQDLWIICIICSYIMCVCFYVCTCI